MPSDALFFTQEKLESTPLLSMHYMKMLPPFTESMISWNSPKVDYDITKHWRISEKWDYCKIENDIRFLVQGTFMREI